MQKCPSQFEGMRDVWTDTLMVISYNQKIYYVRKRSAKF